MGRKQLTIIGVLAVAGLALAIAAVATQQVAENEREIPAGEVPAAVMATIVEAAQGATIGEIEMDTENGQVVYEAEIIIDGKEVDIEVAADGTLLGKEADEDDEDDEADDEQEEQEEIVSLDAVPAAVKATIENEAAGAEIKEVEMETEDGVTVYEAEVIIDGQEIDIKVAADGKLVGKEVEEEDDD